MCNDCDVWTWDLARLDHIPPTFLFKQLADECRLVTLLGELRKGRIIHAHGPSPSCSINNRLHYSAKGIFRHIWRPKLVGWLYLDREYLGVFSFVDRKPFVENQRGQADRWAFSCLWNSSASEGFAPHQEPWGFCHVIFLSSRLFCGFAPP